VDASGTKHLSEKRDKGVSLYFIITRQFLNRRHLSYQMKHNTYIALLARCRLTNHFEPMRFFIILFCSGYGVDRFSFDAYRGHLSPSSWDVEGVVGKYAADSSLVAGMGAKLCERTHAKELFEKSDAQG
jgi:hypothetical protein